jgi:protein-arginine kinase activator protein McsA
MDLIYIICIPVYTMSNFEVDNRKNSDESSTNVEASFSCDKCGQTFDSRQKLKEHGISAHQLL